MFILVEHFKDIALFLLYHKNVRLSTIIACEISTKMGCHANTNSHQQPKGKGAGYLEADYRSKSINLRCLKKLIKH